MALQGSIKDFGLPDIFQLIGLQRKTGMLTLQHEGETVTVAFESGMVVNADSSSKRLEDRLGSLLVKQGKLTEDKLEEVLQKQKATLQRLGHILVSGTYITAKDLKDALQVQVSQNVFKLFRWKEGDYNFEPTDKVEYDRASFSPMSSDFILMEGIRMVDEWPIIEKKIPSLDIVFRAAVDRASIAGEGGGEEDGAAAPAEPKAAANKIHLSADESRVFERVDGVRTVQAIIDVTGLSDFDACKALYDLLSRNIVAPTGREAVTVEPGARAPEATPALGYALFTLTALLSLGGLFVQGGAPFGVLTRPPLLREPVDRLLDGVSRARLERLDRSLEAFRLTRRALPPSLDELVLAGLVDRSSLVDARGRPYRYAPAGAGYVLSGAGPGGEPSADRTIERAFPPPSQP